MLVDINGFSLDLKEEKDGTLGFSNRGSKISNDPLIMRSSITQPVNGNNLYNMIIDCDEVLVNINHKLFGIVKETLPHYFTDNHNTLYDFDVNIRHEYYFEKWLNIDNQKEIENVLDKVNQDNTFYNDLKPTEFFQSLSQILTYVGKIHIVTKIIGHENDPLNISKKKFLGTYFKHIRQQNPHVELFFHFLQPSDSKIEYINRNSIDFNTFVDDQDKNILEVISKTKMRNFEILCPLLGYNRKLTELLKTTYAQQFFDSGSRFTFYHAIDKMSPTELHTLFSGMD